MKDIYKVTASYFWEKVTEKQAEKRRKSKKALMLLEYLLLRKRWDKKGRVTATLDNLKKNLKEFDEYLEDYKKEGRTEIEDKIFIAFWDKKCLRTTHRINNVLFEEAGILSYIRVNNKEKETFCLEFEKGFINNFIDKYKGYTEDVYLSKLKHYISYENNDSIEYKQYEGCVNEYFKRIEEIIYLTKNKNMIKCELGYSFGDDDYIFERLDFKFYSFNLLNDLFDYLNNLISRKCYKVCAYLLRQVRGSDNGILKDYSIINKWIEICDGYRYNAVSSFRINKKEVLPDTLFDSDCNNLISNGSYMRNLKRYYILVMGILEYIEKYLLSNYLDEAKYLLKVLVNCEPDKITKFKIDHILERILFENDETGLTLKSIHHGENQI